jgi:hypothetical protein
MDGIVGDLRSMEADLESVEHEVLALGQSI